MSGGAMLDGAEAGGPSSMRVPENCPLPENCPYLKSPPIYYRHKGEITTPHRLRLNRDKESTLPLPRSQPLTPADVPFIHAQQY